MPNRERVAVTIAPQVLELRGEVFRWSVPHRRPGSMQRDGDYWPAVTVAAGSRVCNARISVTHCAAASLGNASTAVTPSGDAESTLAYLLRGHLTYSACCVLIARSICR